MVYRTTCQEKDTGGYRKVQRFLRSPQGDGGSNGGAFESGMSGARVWTASRAVCDHDIQEIAADRAGVDGVGTGVESEDFMISLGPLAG